MKRLNLLGIIAFINIALITSITASNTEIPLWDQVKHGVLPNGLTYYVLHNEEPKDRASFYIVQNVGAILENDDQNGLAHFLEHMAFNGTKNFPDKKILEYLESYGVAFGQNINAYTNLDETVYNLSNVPVNNENLIDSTLLVLHDWSNYLSLESAEIDKERGVIREEWRTRRSGKMRVYFETRKYLFEGSKYAKRDVIGSLDVINNFDHKVLRDFYHDYYRTDLQAIVVVGDIDAAKIEQKIIDKFSGIPAVTSPKKREYFNVPNNTEPIVGMVTDPEETSLMFSLNIKHNAVPNADKNLNYYRNTVLESLYSQMIGARYNELVQKGNPPFIYAFATYYNSIPLKDIYTVGCALNENNFLGGIEAALTENERVVQHGFTSSEFERAKLSLLSMYQKAFNERNKQNNDKLAREMQYHYLKNEPFPGIEYEYDLIQQILPTVSLTEINDLAKKWNTDENVVITISGPEKEGLVYPEKGQVLELLSKVMQQKHEPYVDKVANQKLIQQQPSPGKVIKTNALTDFGANCWELENGAKVIIKSTDFKDDEITMHAFSKGGTSLYEVHDLPSAAMLENFIGAFGIGDLDNVMLQKVLAGKIVQVSPYLNELYEGFRGNSSVNDFETMLQLVHLYFEQPRFDEEAYEALKMRYTAYVANLGSDINKAFRDSIELITTNYSTRTILLNPGLISNIDYNTMERIYKERFADAADFTFVFTGNIDPEKAKPIIETYIGSIKSMNRNENWQENNEPHNNNNVAKAFSKNMEVPKTTIYIKMHGTELSYNAKNRLYMDVIAKLLQKRYLEVIREDEGGTYGVGVMSELKHYPKETYSLKIKFDTDPEKAEKLKQMVYNEIEKLQTEGVNTEELTETKNNILKTREENLLQNAYWLNALTHYYKHNETIVTPESLEHIVQEITPEKIEKFAKEYLPKTNTIEIVMSPI